MIYHGIISSYEDDRARVLSLDIPNHITPPLIVPPYMITGGALHIGTMVVYVVFLDGTGIILGILKEVG